MRYITNDREEILAIAWAVTATTVLAAFAAWGQSLRWDIIGVSTYQLFPIFGLFAFSLLWSQYMMLALQKYWQTPREKLRSYFRQCGWLVLAALLLHPSLLIWQLWRDGFGLPPGSYLQHFVAPDLAWVALLGMVSLGVFLVYEFWRLFRDFSWWRYIVYACDLAMLAVFYHGLRLGNQLQGDWYFVVWIIYGLCLLVVLPYVRANDFRSRQ